LTSEPGTVLVAGEAGIYYGSGDKWEKHPAPPPGRIIAATIGKMPDKSAVIYATVPTAWQAGSVSGGIYVTGDHGRTWRASNNGLLEKLQGPGTGRPPAFRAIACSAENGSTAYVGFEGLRLGEGAGSLFNGIAKTADGGASWTIVHQESNRPSSNLEGTWIENRAPEGGSIWFDTPYSLGAAPRDPGICYATDLFRTYRTLDGGGSWKEVNSRRVAGDRWTTRGLDVTTCYGVHFDPFDSRHVTITYTDIGMFQSSDAGASWTGSTEGIPRRWRNTTYWIDFDAKVKGLLWGAFSGTHDLPRPKMWRRGDPENYRGGVGISTDGGLHWQPSNQGMPESAVTHILVDPSSPVGARVLYACAFGRGVFKSSDSGKSWQLKNAGIEIRQPFAWRITRADDGTLYLVVARRSEGGEIGNDRDGALFKSTDGAEHWTGVPLPEGTNGPNGLTIDPKDARRLYLSAWGVEREGGDTGGGIFLSGDGGRSWQNIFSESQHIYDVTVDPRNADTLYACGFDSGAYRSLDRGKSWARIRGYNFKWGHRVIPDPTDAAKVYITTYGGSVWHGPAAGDPKAQEDVVNK
jgi:photosystem II stability/assembly factor-like uncharacterized protein